MAIKAGSIQTAMLASCLFSLAACSDSPTDVELVEAVVLNASPVDVGGSIFRSVNVELDIPGSVQVEYWAEGAPRLRVTEPDTAATHSVYLPRLRGETSYEYEVRPIHSDGGLGSPLTGQFQTDTLPSEFAEYRFQVIGDATFPVVMLGSESVMIDTDGHVVWYGSKDNPSNGFTRRANGDFVFRTPAGLEVVTPMNEAVATLTEADAIARTGRSTFFMHHDVITTPENTLLFLVRDGTVTLRDTTWVGDEVWEWDPDIDDLELRWAASDFFWPETDRGDRSIPGDWLHANSISLGPRGNVVVSFFWLHEVLSIAADYQSIEWRLGGPNSSVVVADGAMEAGQHTAAEVNPNRVLLFDNGRDRPGGELFSRASEIELDHNTGTARLVWEFRPQPDIYAPVVSSARRLENGNTVVGFGLDAGRFSPPSTGPLAAFEVTPSGRILWQMTILAGTSGVYRFDPLTDIAGEVEVPAS